MPQLVTLDNIRANIMFTVSETQGATRFTDFINLTLQEIFNARLWTWRRRKTTVATVISQEDYNLDEEIDQIALLRQRTSPTKLYQVPDEDFYRLFPNLEDLGTGSPRWYRLWEETGFSTNITTAETITVVSSSASDTSTFTVRVTGRNANGLIVQETITMNGVTGVVSANTYQAAGLISIAKSAATTGTITVTGTTSSTVMVRIAPNQIAPRFKRLSLYPVPSAVITLYLEYYETFRELINDNDIPQMDTKWWWVAREGALSKAWDYKQNDAAKIFHLQNFLRGLKQMENEDLMQPDLIKVLRSRQMVSSVVKRYADSSSNNFPQYAAGY